MATQLFLRSVGTSPAPTTGEKSSALPVGTFDNGIGGHGEKALRAAHGVAQLLDGGWSPASTAHYDSFIARFSSEMLSAQTIAADTWTLAIATKETNANANSFTAVSLYVWRPGTNSVVGFIYDSDSPLGTEWALSLTGQVLTFSGAQVVSASGDILVLEIWRHTSGQAVATAYDQEIAYEGSAAVTAGQTSNCGSYLSTPANTLSFGGISGTITMNAPQAQLSMSGSALGGRVGTIAMAAPALTISVAGTVGPAVAPVVVASSFNPGYAWTTQQLIDAINANTRHTDCPLDHSDAPGSYHKEPLPRQEAADNALTPSGYVKTILHLKDPAGIYYTTVIAEKP